MAEEQRITSREGGPLIVTGEVPLVRKTAIHSEHGLELHLRCGLREHKGLSGFRPDEENLSAWINLELCI